MAEQLHALNHGLHFALVHFTHGGELNLLQLAEHLRGKHAAAVREHDLFVAPVGVYGHQFKQSLYAELLQNVVDRLLGQGVALGYGLLRAGAVFASGYGEQYGEAVICQPVESGPVLV